MSGGGCSMFAIPSKFSSYPFHFFMVFDMQLNRYLTQFEVTDPMTIAWGQGTLNGELGYGEEGPKSSTTPQKVIPLEGLAMIDVSCGAGHTLLLAKHGA